MNYCFSRGAALIFLLFVSFNCLVFGQDASIDQLLKKLPPPEKFAPPPVERVLQQTDPALKDPLGKEIVLALQRRNVARAVDLSRQLAQRYPRSTGAHSLYGSIALGARRYGEAASAFRKVIEIRPNLAFAYFMLGNVEASQQHFATALPHFQKAAELEPKNPVALVFVSVCAERAGRKQQALDYAKRTTAVSPAFVGGWIQLARVERALAHPQETLAALNRAAGLLPDNAYILATVGYAYINLNKIPEAIPPLQHAARISPKDFLVQSQLGYCLQVTGRVDAAIDHLKKGASLNKNYGPVWEHLGLAYQQQGRHREAAKAFERATQIMPTYRLAWQHLAEEYRAVGQTAEANRAAARAQSLPLTAPKSREKKKG